MPPQTNSQFSNSTPPIINPSKKDSKFILLIILGLILIAINIFFVYQTYFQNTEVVEDEQNLVVDETANWKTYRNEEYGFEFKYPSLGIYNEIKVTKEKEITRIAVMYKYKELSYTRNLFSFSIFPNKEKLTLDKWFADDSCSKTLLDSGFYLLDKKDGYNLFRYSSSTSPLPDDYDFENCGPVGYVYYMSLSDKDWVVGFTYDYQDNNLPDYGYNTTEKITNLLEEILSTFKFISTSTQTIDTTNWKTYRNEGYGFEIKYPNDWNYIYYTDNHGMEFNPRDPDCQCDTPSQLYITYYKSYSDFKITNNKQEENIETYIKNNFSLEKPITRNIDGFDFVCGRTDGIGDPTECVGKTKDGYIFFMTYSTGDKESESVIYTFKFIN